MGNRQQKNQITGQQSAESTESVNSLQEIKIKYFPTQGISDGVKGTLTLNIEEPLKLLFLDPMDSEGEESVELDMKVYK